MAEEYNEAHGKSHNGSPVGIRVPKGGSSCAKCEYLKDAKKQLCRNKKFIAWRGRPKFDWPANEYCCNYFDWPGAE